MTSDLKCLRCRYTWKRRTWNRLPRQCPNCHRNDWNKPEVGPVGRPPLKAKEVMPSDSIQQTNGDISGEHRAEMMSTSAKPVVEPQYKHKAYGVTYGNMVPHVLTEDEMPPQAKGDVETIVRKRYDDAVASLVRGPTQQDASTDDLLDHLLEQIKREEV